MPTAVATAINDRDHVAGTLGNGDGFLWRNGRITNLGRFSPTDVNNRDEVVGYQHDGTNSRAVLWRNAVRTDFGGLPGGDSSFAMAINDRGVIAGDNPTTTEGLLPHAVIWTR